MNAQDFLFAGYFVVALFLGSLNQRFRTVAVILAISIVALYPNGDQVAFVYLFAIPALLLASFSDN